MDKTIACEISGAAAQAPPVLFESDLMVLLPQLKSFTGSLCHDRTLANDIAQQALLKAWRARDRFVPGTNLKAWLFTIARNEFFSHKRRSWRETHWDDEKGENISAPADEQEWALNLSDGTRALNGLPATQREALLLIGVGGFSYDDAADFCGMNTGTMKSRVARGRNGLSDLLTGIKPLLPRSAGRNMTPAEDILAQLSALKSVGTARTTRM